MLVLPVHLRREASPADGVTEAQGPSASLPKTFVRFALVGASAVVLNLLLFFVLVGLAGLGYLLATTFIFFLGNAYGWVANRMFTFELTGPSSPGACTLPDYHGTEFAGEPPCDVRPRGRPRGLLPAREPRYRRPLHGLQFPSPQALDLSPRGPGQGALIPPDAFLSFRAATRTTSRRTGGRDAVFLWADRSGTSTDRLVPHLLNHKVDEEASEHDVHASYDRCGRDE